MRMIMTNRRDSDFPSVLTASASAPLAASSGLQEEYVSDSDEVKPDDDDEKEEEVEGC